VCVGEHNRTNGRETLSDRAEVKKKNNYNLKKKKKEKGKTKKTAASLNNKTRIVSAVTVS